MRRYTLATIILLIIFLLGALTSITIFLKTGGNFNDNILPELFGFFLEGSIFVIVFAYFEKRRAIYSASLEKQNSKLALRSYLGIFLYWISLGIKGNKGREASAKILSEPVEITKLINEIEIIINKNEGHDFCDLSLNFVTNFAKRELTILTSLLPTASSIGPNHLRHWGGIINSLQGIIESESNEKALQAIHGFLHHIEIFDNEDCIIS